MITPPPEDLIEFALRLSRQLLERARENEWETVTNIEKKRRELIEAIFPLKPDPERPDQKIEAMIREIIDIDHLLVEEINNRKQHLLERLRGEQIERTYASV